MTQPIPFGKYYLLERINVGGMAEVFKAKAVGVEGFERTVAVKRILPSIAEDQEFITMFIDEAKIAVQLTHANIAQIFDLGRVDESYFIALEYVHGKDLRAIFNRARTRGQPVPYALACYAILKACEGLEYAHNKRDAAGQFLNLVHRDVSPQNVLISYEGEVKIIDFGIAKAAGKVGNTQAGILKGKFGYMSPEQANAADIDRRSDLFAVGICLYELVTGERAFLGDTDLATLDNVRTVSLIPPRARNPAIPEALETIVLKALSADREQRHQTAQALQQDLAAFLRSEGKGAADRRELSGYMRREFAEELANESARDLEQDESAIAADEVSGLSVFDHIEPQEVAFELRAGGQRVGRGQHKTTLHGLPALIDDTPLGGPRPVVSGWPRPASVPPVPPPRAEHASVPPAAARGPELEWDEEELSTQIYDPPEERAAELGEAPAGPRPSWASELPSATRTLSGRPPPYQPEPEPAPPSFRERPQRGPNTQTLLASRASPAPRPTLVAGTAAVLALGIAGFLWFFRAPASGVIELETAPNDVAVSLDGRPVSGGSPFVIRGVTVGAAHTLTVQKVGYRPWARRVELRHGQTLRLPPLSLEALESGFALDSVPSGANVFVNGVRLGQTTPVRVAALGVGEHRIRVEAQGYSPWESSVKVATGTVLDLPVAQLIARTAEPFARRPDSSPAAERANTVAARMPAPSDVAAAGVARPPAMPHKPPPVARNPQPAGVAAGAVPKVATGDEATGTLRIQTKPWSTVTVDGKPAGTTPLMNVSVKAGKHTLTFVNEEFGIHKSVVVQVEPGQVSTHVLDLTR